MSEQTAEAPATETEAAATEGTSEQQAEQPKPSETVDFWKQKAREQEKRAKENAAAAQRLAEIEESQKSEAQKAADALAKAEERAAAAERRVLALDIATENKLGQEDAALIAVQPDEDSMRALAARLSADETARKQNGNFVPGEGTAPKSGEGSEGAFARQLFSSGD